MKNEKSGSSDTFIPAPKVKKGVPAFFTFHFSLFIYFGKNTNLTQSFIFKIEGSKQKKTIFGLCL